MSQNQSGSGGEEENSQLVPGINPYNPDRAARSLSLFSSAIFSVI